MTRSLQNDQVGDTKTPPLEPDAGGLRFGADQASTLQSDLLPKFVVSTTLSSIARSKAYDEGLSPVSCKQTVWLSFFFDGTGNNMDADTGTQKHSNVAKLYRVHVEDDETKGIYRIYIPGVGTYFSEVGDDGGSTLGLAAGSKGDARLEWALAQFDEKMRPHIARANSPATAILEVNVAVFGFSRGAALARAFINRLLEGRGVQLAEDKWQFKGQKCPLRIRFMGLFDTVASVGVAMSKNNMSMVGTTLGVRSKIAERLTSRSYRATRPDALAFAEGALPGADPAPGKFNGHLGYGGELIIPPMVEEVRHFVAAHELRNSFPLDSITIIQSGKVIKPAQFFESVFPGVHSDIGGSYRPGEGGRMLDGSEKLGLVTLHQMYDFALERQLPLNAKSCWSDDSKDDFEISPKLIESFRYYSSHLSHATTLGVELNAHMRIYYAWRFRVIRLKQQGDRREAEQIESTSIQYKKERSKLEDEIRPLEVASNRSAAVLRAAQQKRLNYTQNNYGNPDLAELPALEANVGKAKQKHAFDQDALLRKKAQLDALPDMSELTSLVALYDAQLMADARAIRDVYSTSSFLHSTSPERHTELRPHYKALMDAYEDEFIRNTGLRDERIIDFFDHYVHDSLAGFAKDATLPSDPRVVYLGGSEKYRYAMREKPQDMDERAYADAGKPSATSMVESA